MLHVGCSAGQAIEHLEMAASLGNANAMVTLGVHYALVPAERNKAAALFKQAADLGNGTASNDLAKLWPT